MLDGAMKAVMQPGPIVISPVVFLRFICMDRHSKHFTQQPSLDMTTCHIMTKPK